MKVKKFTQYVLVELSNCGPFVYLVTSPKPITMKRVITFVTRIDDFNEDRDAITLIEPPYKVKL